MYIYNLRKVTLLWLLSVTLSAEVTGAQRSVMVCENKAGWTHHFLVETPGPESMSRH